MANAALNETKPADFHLDTSSAAPPPAAKMVTVKLLKNYRPINPFETVGYTREAILKKNAAGMMETVRPEEFIEGELPPAVQVGTGFETKLWSGAVIKLPADEAKSMRKAGIAEYEVLD